MREKKRKAREKKSTADHMFTLRKIESSQELSSGFDSDEETNVVVVHVAWSG
jgi:hypothetical protein